MMKTSWTVRCACIALILLPSSPLRANSDKPQDRFFNGVEDRIKEAHSIVAGRAEITDEKPVEKSSRQKVRARIQIEQVLKGDESLQQIEYSSVYAPLGYGTFSGQKYWSTEDDEHARLIESFPYAVAPLAIFFLKREGEAWKPFYVFLDDEKHTTRFAIAAIIKAEQSLEKQEPKSVLAPLLASAESPMVQEYAVRAIMDHVDSWQDRAGLLVSAAPRFRTDESFYSYVVGSTVARLRHDIHAQDAEKCLDFIVALVQAAPNSSALDYAVQQTRRVLSAFQGHSEKAVALRVALLSRRSILNKAKQTADVLTEKDQALLTDMGVPGVLWHAN